ncbi:MAG: DUF393 domain-containing protein [Fimbriimonadales bacterium]|nr:DUF393 domain-containing protein [Fimbriimonadales bacterium]
MKPVVLYDGDCAFCRRAIACLLRLPRSSRVVCLPRDAPEAANLLQGRARADSLLLRDGDGWHEGSEAVLRAARHAGLHPALLLPLLLAPRSLRESVYRVIARNRHRLCRGGACEPPKLDRKSHG